MSDESRPGRAGTRGVPREVREQQIIEVATRLFGDHGYANVPLSKIAAAAGVSKPLIYAYFESRDGLHAACVRRAGDPLVEAVAAAQSTPAVTGRAVATLTGIFQALDGATQGWKLIYDATLPRPSEAFDVARHYQNALNGMGASGVAELLTEAGVTDPQDHSLMLTIWFQLVSTTIAWWHDNPQDSPAEMTDRFVRVFGTLTGTDLGR